MNVTPVSAAGGAPRVESGAGGSNEGLGRVLQALREILSMCETCGSAAEPEAAGEPVAEQAEQRCGGGSCPFGSTMQSAADNL